jgi:hypothetical protein
MASFRPFDIICVILSIGQAFSMPMGIKALDLLQERQQSA